MSLYQPKLNILYEDEHILLLDKRPGLVVIRIERASQYPAYPYPGLLISEEGVVSLLGEFLCCQPLCNRIDRNTGGIVIAAKTAEGLRVMNQKIKDRELSKYYLCVVQGRMAPKEGKLEGYLFKDEVKKQVYVRGPAGAGGQNCRYLI